MAQVYPYVPEKIQGMLVADQVRIILSFGFQALSSQYRVSKSVRMQCFVGDRSVTQD